MRRRFSFTLLALVSSLLGISSAEAEIIIGAKPQQVDERIIPMPDGIDVRSWATGLIAPWALVFLTDGRALVTERDGKVRWVTEGHVAPDPAARVDVAEGGEGGLMGMAAHPSFSASNPFIYLMYTYAHDVNGGNRVARYRLDGKQLHFDRIIIDKIPGGRFHDGGRIAFGPDGMLYVTCGEVFQRELAQGMTSLGGKILRVDPEGRIPADNPFPGSPIYSLGHRNPQGLAWRPENKRLFASEHGPSGEVGFGAYDEVNVIQPGGNYGWPRVVGAPELAPYHNPIVAWTGTATPPSGMTFWRGALFIATLRSQALVRLTLSDPDEKATRVTGIERWFGGDRGLGRLRDAVVGPDGALYLVTNNRDGRGQPRKDDDHIWRIN